MGPSGAGKSTLLNCISGRQQTGVTGEVLVKTHSDYSLNSLKVVYVPQQDHLMPYFTVFETLMFSAKLHLATYPSNGRSEAKIVEDIINTLHLSPVKVS